MHALCEQCAVAPLLRELIFASEQFGKCSLCGVDSTRVLPTREAVFIRAVKALIRYHYSEWDYHGKLGGDSFEQLLSRANPIFVFREASDDCKYEDFILSVLDSLDSDHNITLFTAYGRDIYNYLAMPAVSLGEHSILSTLKQELDIKNYFEVEVAFESTFQPLQKSVSGTIHQSEQFFRARIGAPAKAANFHYIEPRSVFYQPYTGQAIGAPPVGNAHAGRLNRPGVSFLYLASDMDTAIAEIRPHPGEFVSVGSFTASRDISIADFSKHDLGRLFADDQELDLLRLIISVENAFAAMAPPSNRQVYSLTQFLAEVFRRMGFEGIRFRSTVGPGINLVIFDPTLVAWNADSARAVKVESVTYKHSPCLLYDSNAIYNVDYD